MPAISRAWCGRSPADARVHAPSTSGSGHSTPSRQAGSAAGGERRVQRHQQPRRTGPRTREGMVDHQAQEQGRSEERQAGLDRQEQRHPPRQCGYHAAPCRSALKAVTNRVAPLQRTDEARDHGSIGPSTSSQRFSAVSRYSPALPMKGIRPDHPSTSAGSGADSAAFGVVSSFMHHLHCGIGVESPVAAKRSPQHSTMGQSAASTT